ncbi:hypothetical protein [Vibrio phage VP41s3]|nr:hypothetical protein [Vibrio phage VP41s3]
MIRKLTIVLKDGTEMKFENIDTHNCKDGKFLAIYTNPQNADAIWINFDEIKLFQQEGVE